MSKTYTRRILATVEREITFSVPDDRDPAEQLSVEQGALEYEQENLADILKHTAWIVGHVNVSVRYGGVVDGPTVTFFDRVKPEGQSDG